jgi:acetyl esterase
MKPLWTLFCLFLTIANISMAQNEMPTPDQVRKSISGDMKSFNIPAEAIFKIENKTILSGADSIKIRIYYPNDARNHKILFNIHGGALVACDLDTHDNISRVLANQTNSVVVAVDYRKAPEFPYPASINDCEAVLAWIKQNAKSIKGNPKNILLVGESGGGLFISSLAVRLRDNLNVRGICLVNPATDLRNPGQGFYGLVTQWYLQGKSANDSIISPVVSKDYHYFPKTLIITCEKDELKSHGVALYDKLKQAGKEVEFMDIPNEDHLGPFWGANHPLAKRAVDKAVMFINSFK